MPFPLSLCQRHPRYALSLFAIIATTFVLLSPRDAFRALPSAVPYVAPSPELPARIARAEANYEHMLDQRQEMIKKYGPSPSQVVMFPPDQEPWPAYTVWDFFPPVYNCPHEQERIGALGDGGKWVCGLSRIAEKPDCIIYSFGVDWDSTFEAEILARTHHCEVYGYNAVSTGFGSQIPRAQRHRTHFERYGLATTDQHGYNDDPKLWTLKSLMKENGHDHIDILHVDVEGYEFEVMRALIREFVSGPDAPGALPFAQLIIEMHVWHQRFTDFLAWWETLEGAGLRPFMSEVNLVYANYNRQSGVELADYSFINTRGDNIFIADPPTLAAADDTREAAGEPDIRAIRHAIV